MLGKRFGNWMIVAPAEPSPRGRRQWLCRCLCTKSTERVVEQNSLVGGKSTSCGCRRATTNRIWTDDKIEESLRDYATQLGRMPTASELVVMEGSNGLAVAVSKRHGYRVWANRLSLHLKDETTHRGQRWEYAEMEFFRGLGFPVEKERTRAGYDLLVSEHRVDVKSATWTQAGKPGNVVRGYVFAGLKNGKLCDFFDLLCIEDDRVKYRYIVPSSAAIISTLTITERTIGGFGKYAPYLNAVDLLRETHGAK